MPNFDGTQHIKPVATDVTGTVVASTIVPGIGENSSIATHYSWLGHGGLRTVRNLSEMYEIPFPRRELGMQVYCLSDHKLYRLKRQALAVEADWVEYYNDGTKVGGGVDLTLAQMSENTDATCWEEIFASGAPGARYLGLIPSDDLTGLVEYPSGQVIAAGDFFYSDGTYNRVTVDIPGGSEAIDVFLGDVFLCIEVGEDYSYWYHIAVENVGGRYLGPPPASLVGVTSWQGVPLASGDFFICQSTGSVAMSGGNLVVKPGQVIQYTGTGWKSQNPDGLFRGFGAYATLAVLVDYTNYPFVAPRAGTFFVINQLAEGTPGFAKVGDIYYYNGSSWVNSDRTYFRNLGPLPESLYNVVEYAGVRIRQGDYFIALGDVDCVMNSAEDIIHPECGQIVICSSIEDDAPTWKTEGSKFLGLMSYPDVEVVDLRLWPRDLPFADNAYFILNSLVGAPDGALVDDLFVYLNERWNLISILEENGSYVGSALPGNYYNITVGSGIRKRLPKVGDFFVIVSGGDFVFSSGGPAVPGAVGETIICVSSSGTLDSPVNVWVKLSAFDVAEYIYSPVVEEILANLVDRSVSGIVNAFDDFDVTFTQVLGSVALLFARNFGIFPWSNTMRFAYGVEDETKNYVFIRDNLVVPLAENAIEFVLNTKVLHYPSRILVSIDGVAVNSSFITSSDGLDIRINCESFSGSPTRMDLSFVGGGCRPELKSVLLVRGYPVCVFAFASYPHIWQEQSVAWLLQHCDSYDVALVPQIEYCEGGVALPAQFFEHLFVCLPVADFGVYDGNSLATLGLRAENGSTDYLVPEVILPAGALDDHQALKYDGLFFVYEVSSKGIIGMDLRVLLP